jgi:hypothetical protein
VDSTAKGFRAILRRVFFGEPVQVSWLGCNMRSFVSFHDRLY